MTPERFTDGMPLGSTPWQTYPEQTRPEPMWGSLPSGYGPAPQRAGTNGFAVASLVLGIVWVYWIGSALALIFGFLALRQIREQPVGGRGLAVAGIVLGGIGAATLLLVTGVAVLSSIHRTM